MAIWSTSSRMGALAWYAQHNGETIFLDVPVARPGWRGWPPDAGEHRFHGVGFHGEPELREWNEDAFSHAVTMWPDATPILAWGFADRPAFGLIAAGLAMLARTYPGHGMLRPVALVAPGSQSPNTAPAYRARGIDIVAVPAEFLS
jgi:hypothetical protein